LFTLVWNPVAMMTLLALALAASPFVPADDLPLNLHGECFYPPRIAEALPDATQVTCDTVAVDAGSVDFELREWSAHSRFFGSWEGDTFTVIAFQPRNGRRTDARGSCRIDHLNGRISMVCCTAVARGRGWLANFRHVRP
jgi:hypothetical protein